MSQPTKTAKDIFLMALDAEQADRAALLDVECAEDIGLRRQVEQLLKVHDEPDSLLDSPRIDLGISGVSVPEISPTIDQPITEKPGTQIGPYKLLQEIGEGGMGMVYMAEQKQPIERRVALKIIKPGMDTRQVIARFEAEEQALAMMDHPNIAKVFDAGTTDSGRPYFVMELVNGIPVTQFCDEQHLTARERLELFIPICQAVQHAHQKGIIHRDIKPSNILIALYDGRPVPKVIDFGVAKATGGRLTEKTVFTDLGQIVGTIEYMSPEQAQRNQLDIDTRSDIYSLGVLLYELLTGDTPFDKQRLRSAALDELLRIIRDEEPPKPSTKVSSSQSLPEVANNRHTEPKKLSALIRGELDWIVMKALDKDRDRRYETATEFANDIQHYLSDEAVTACPPSSVYRFGKFARRNKVAMLTTAIVAASLFAGLVGTSWQAIRATRAEYAAIAERDQKDAAEKTASEEAAIAKAVNEFLNEDLLGAADPHAEPNRDLKVREVLDRAAQNIAGRFADQPLIEAAIRITIGNSYVALGQYDEAEPHLQRAQELRRQYLGDNDDQTLNASLSLTWLAHERGQYQQAAAQLEEIVDHCQRILGEESLTTIRALEQLGDVKRHLGQFDEALSLAEKVIALRRRIQGPEHPDTLNSLSNLAKSYQDAGQIQKALPLLEQTLELKRKVRGPENPSTLTSMGYLVEAYANVAQYDRAITLGQQCLELKCKILGPEHPDTLVSMGKLAIAYQNAGMHSRSIELAEQTLELMRKIRGPEHPKTLMLIDLLAGAYHDAGQYDKALELYEQVLELNRKVRGLEHPITLMTMNNLVVLYHAQGKYAEAEELCNQILEIQRRVLGAEHPDTLASLNNLAGVYQAQRKYAEAEPILTQVLDIQRRVLGPEHPETLTTLGNLAMSSLFAEQYEKAIELHGQTLELKRKVLGPEHPSTLISMDNLARAYRAAGQQDKALELHRQTLERKRAILGPEHPGTQTTMTNLIMAYTEAGRPANVQSLATDLLAIRRRTLSPDDPQLANTLALLGQSLIDMDRSQEAEPLLRECLAIREEKLPDAWQSYSAKSLLGGCLSAQGKHEEAEGYLIDGYQGLKARSDAWPPNSRIRRLSDAVKQLINHYESISQPEEVARWRAELEQLAESDKQATPPGATATTDKEHVKPND